jgi:hypothetical protein
MPSIHLAHADAIPLAVVRRRAAPGDLSTVVPQACGLVWSFVRARHLAAGRNVALYLNAAIDLQVGVEIMAAFDPADDVIPSSTPPGLAASTVHFGPYQQVGTAHDAIIQWCAANGHRVAGPRWEIYGHWQPDWNTDPSRIRTDVFYQVVPG